MSVRAVFLGPPGAGKGTQARELAREFSVPHIATGDILRDAVKKETPEGKLAKPFMSNGQLVPDAVVNDIVNSRIRSLAKPDFVMDGYPRTVEQANSFDQVLTEKSLPLDAVIYLKVEDEEIVNRNSRRLTCVNPTCMETYNTLSKPPKVAMRCDKCEQLLYQREDDKPDTIRRRLQIFHQEHSEVLKHYQRQKLLVELPGIGDMHEINKAIEQSLRRRGMGHA